MAFMHWGQEFVTTPGARELQLADDLRKRGVDTVVGAHPHAAGTDPKAIGSGETLLIHSIGNFLFDQSSEVSSGALVELRAFPQGTVFARPRPLPHLADLIASGDSPDG